MKAIHLAVVIVGFILIGEGLFVEANNPSSYHRHSISLLNDLLNHDVAPIAVSFAVCWKPSDLVRLFKIVTRPISIIEDFFEIPSGVGVTMTVLDLNCRGNIDLWLQYNSIIRRHQRRWLILFSDCNEETVNNELIWKDLPIWLDSHIIVAKWNGQYFQLTQVYNIQDDNKNQTIFEAYGKWQPHNEHRLVDVRETEILSRRRRNLRKSPLAASFVVVNNDSINHLTDNVDPNIDTVTKTNYLILIALTDVLNVTARYRFVHTWGELNATTKLYTGMMGDLQTGAAVVAGSTVFLTHSRIALFEYSSMINPTLVRFVFRSPPLTYVTNIYALPFASTVWLAAVAIVAISCAVIYASYRWGDDIMASTTMSSDAVSGWDVLLMGFGAIAQMGTTLEARTMSTKIAMITFFVFVLFMFISYTANIVSLLQATDKSIRTIEDLYRSQLGIGVDDVPYNRYWMPNSVDKIKKALYNEKIAGQPSKWMNVSVGVARMRQGMYAFHAEQGPIFREIEKTFYEHEKCGLVLIDYLGMTAPWVALPKRSPFKEVIRVNLFKIREHGIQSREINKMYKKKPICTESGQTFLPVRFVDCSMLVQFLGTGLAVATIVFFAEMIWHRFSGHFVQAISRKQ